MTTTYYRIRSTATGDLAALRFGSEAAARRFMRRYSWPQSQYVVEIEVAA